MRIEHPNHSPHSRKRDLALDAERATRLGKRRAEIAGQCQIYASALAVPLSDTAHEQATRCWVSSGGRGTKSMKRLLARHFRPGCACVHSLQNTGSPAPGLASGATVGTNRTGAGFLMKSALRIRKPLEARTCKRRLRARYSGIRLRDASAAPPNQILEFAVLTDALQAPAVCSTPRPAIRHVARIPRACVIGADAHRRSPTRTKSATTSPG